MRITYDPDKNARNIAERGLSFDEVADLDLGDGSYPRGTTGGTTARSATACSGGSASRLFTVVFTPRAG